jgi:hypothetical protein
VFREALERYGNEAAHAWLGVYCALLWYTPTGRADHPRLPHIIDANLLRRPPTGALGGWQKRALRVEQHLAEHMGCAATEVADRVDGLMRHPAYGEDMQRQNPLGLAFIGLVKHVLETYGNRDLAYQSEQPADTVFPGITFPGRSTGASMDVLIRKGDRPRAIVSAKWGVRHDRVNDLTNECPVYKSAALRMRQDFAYVVITNEFDPSRLRKLLTDSCIDAVVHVHKPAVVSVLGLNGDLADLWDLTDLIAWTGEL